MVRVMAAPEVRRHASQTHTTSASISHGEYAPGSDMVPRTGAAPLALMAVVRRRRGTPSAKPSSVPQKEIDRLGKV